MGAVVGGRGGMWDSGREHPEEFGAPLDAGGPGGQGTWRGLGGSWGLERYGGLRGLPEGLGAALGAG